MVCLRVPFLEEDMGKAFIKQAFGLLVLVILSACSIESSNCTDVNQAKIYQSYSATYDAKDDKTSVSATLRFDGASGNTLIMDGKCAIKHDSISLDRNTLLGTSYTGSKNGYVAAHIFTFTNNNSKEHINSITNSNTVALVSPPSTVSRGSDLTLTFTPAVGKKETVYVNIAYVNLPTTTGVTRSSAFKSATTEGATTATIAKSDLAEMSSDGAVSLYAERTLSKDLDQTSDSEGGSMSYRYNSARSSATLGN